MKKNKAGAFQRQMRHEVKFYLSFPDYVSLSMLMSGLLPKDKHGDANNNYYIRSLYFDDAYDSAFEDKVNGVQRRDKYRIRYYNFNPEDMVLECKHKDDYYVAKDSVRISRDMADKLIACDADGLEHAKAPLLRDMFRLIKTKGLHPVVLVDYLREAYVHPVENIRITFDKNLRSGIYATDIYNSRLPLISPLERDYTILEVKYDNFLPLYLREVLSTVPSLRMAISKYELCRAVV